MSNPFTQGLDLSSVLADPRTPPGMRAAAMAAMQAQKPQMPPGAAPEAPQAAMPQMGGSDVTAPIRTGAALADQMRAPMAAMARGGAVRGYAGSGAVSASGGSDTGVSMEDWESKVGKNNGGLAAVDPRMLAAFQAQFQNINNPASDDDEDGGGLAGMSAATPEDKGLALAQFGFGMAASKSPHLGQAIGEGGTSALKALQQMRQQRALNEMKKATLQNNMETAKSLREYRSVLSNAAGVKTDLTNASRMTPPQLRTLVDTIKSTGNLGLLSKLGAGPAATANKADALRMITEEAPDLAAVALAYAEKTGEAGAFGRGQGQRASGTFKENLGAGESTPGPVAPLSIKVPGIAPAVAAPTAAPVRAPVAVPAVTPAPTAVAAPTVAPAAPEQDARYALLPTPQPLPQPTTTGMRKEVDEQGEALGKLSGQIDAAANGAKSSNFIYNNMNAARDHFVTGKGAGIWNEANAYLLQAANGLNATLGSKDKPVIDTKSLEDSVGNYTDFEKNAVNLTGAATKAVSPRASQQEMMFLSKGVPSSSMPDKGYDLIVNQLQAVNDFAVAQQRAKQLYLENPKNNSKTLNGFDTWFNQNLDPSVFMLHRMSPEDAAAAIASLDKRPGGEAMKKKLVRQINTAKTLGLFAED